MISARIEGYREVKPENKAEILENTIRGLAEEIGQTDRTYIIPILERLANKGNIVINGLEESLMICSKNNGRPLYVPLFIPPQEDFLYGLNKAIREDSPEIYRNLLEEIQIIEGSLVEETAKWIRENYPN